MKYIVLRRALYFATYRTCRDLISVMQGRHPPITVSRNLLLLGLVGSDIVFHLTFISFKARIMEKVKFVSGLCSLCPAI